MVILGNNPNIKFLYIVVFNNGERIIVDLTNNS